MHCEQAIIQLFNVVTIAAHTQFILTAFFKINRSRFQMNLFWCEEMCTTVLVRAVMLVKLQYHDPIWDKFPREAWRTSWSIWSDSLLKANLCYRRDAFYNDTYTQKPVFEVSSAKLKVNSVLFPFFFPPLSCSKQYFLDVWIKQT